MFTFVPKFPAYTEGMEGVFIFEVRTVEKKILEAVTDGTSWFGKGEDGKFSREVTIENVLGWRETYTCEDARKAIAWFVDDPRSIRARDGAWADALQRHIKNCGGADSEKVTCKACAREFVKQWRKAYGEIPEGWEAYA